MIKTEHPKLFTKPELYLCQSALSFNSVCNADCLYCCGRITTEPCMPLEKAKEVLKVVINDFRIKDVYPTCSAELTLYPHLLDIMKYVESLNVPYLKVTQDTNGRYIPKDFIEQMNSMKTYWTISISVWGYDEESWQKYQGKGDWSLFVSNVKRYLTELKTPPSFSMVCINEEQKEKTLEFITSISKDCGHEVFSMSDGRSDFLKPLKENGIVPIVMRNFRSPLTDGGISYVHPNDSPKECKDFIEFNNCNFLYRSIVMDSAGYIYPCLSVNGKKEYAIGNVFDYEPFTKDSLIEMIHSKKGMEWWEKNVTKGEVACDICKTCTTRCAY